MIGARWGAETRSIVKFKSEWEKFKEQIHLLTIQ